MKIDKKSNLYWYIGRILSRGGIIEAKIGNAILGDKSSSECKIGYAIWKSGMKMSLKGSTMMINHLKETW